MSGRATAAWRALLVPAFSQKAEYLAPHLIAKGLKAVGQIQPVGKADKVVHRVGMESRLLICSQIGKAHAHSPVSGGKVAASVASG